MPPPDQLQLPNPTGHNGQGQHPGTGAGAALPSAPSYYAFGSSVQRHYARPSGSGDWSASYATMRMPPPEQPFTEDMQDLQARGKDPYGFTRRDEPYYSDRLESLRATERRPSGAAPLHHMSPNFVRPPSPGPQLPDEPPLDDFANLERRRHATTVLDSPELLMMYAQSFNDSIPAVRMTFMRIMCGYDADTMLSPSVIADSLAAAASSSHGPYDPTSMGKRRQTSSGSSGGGSSNNGHGSSSSSGSSGSQPSRGKFRKR